MSRITHRCCGTLDQRLESVVGQQVTLLLKESHLVHYVHRSALPGNLARGTTGIAGVCEYHSDRKKASTNLMVTTACRGIADIELRAVDS